MTLFPQSCRMIKRTCATSPQLLHGARHGDPVAEERLMESIYSELHQLAAKFLSGERVDHTLQPTALVNEAYLKLFGKKVTPWENRAHFYVSAARTMRRILVDYARAGAAVKRPSRQDRVEMSNVLALWCGSARQSSSPWTRHSNALPHGTNGRPRSSNCASIADSPWRKPRPPSASPKKP